MCKRSEIKNACRHLWWWCRWHFNFINITTLKISPVKNKMHPLAKCYSISWENQTFQHLSKMVNSVCSARLSMAIHVNLQRKLSFHLQNLSKLASSEFENRSLNILVKMSAITPYFFHWEMFKPNLANIANFCHLQHQPLQAHCTNHSAMSHQSWCIYQML